MPEIDIYVTVLIQPNITEAEDANIGEVVDVSGMTAEEVVAKLKSDDLLIDVEQLLEETGMDIDGIIHGMPEKV